MSNLPTLPDVNFVDTNVQQIIDDIVSSYEELAGRTLGRGDPIRLFLLSLAYVIINQRNLINTTGKDNLLYYAKGDFLDQLAIFRNVQRVTAAPAVTTLRFTLSAVQAGPVGIPQGTRASSDYTLYFRTVEPATIAACQ